MWSLEVPRLRLVIFGLVLGVSSSTLERGGALAADAAQLPLPDDPDLACSGVRAVASVLQARYAQGYRKSRDRSADGRDRLARSAMSSVCRQAFEQWAIIGKNPDDPGSKRRYSDFQAAMGGGSVQMETMGPDVTKQLQQLCTAVLGAYTEEVAAGYRDAQGPDTFRLTDRLTELSGTCKKKKKKKKKKQVNKKGKKTKTKDL